MTILGINGLQEPFPQEEFERLLDLPFPRNKPLGEILIDPRLVAEIGNVYKCEVLFQARLNPETKVNELSNQERKLLGQTISLVLKKALARELKWYVYGASWPCLVCGSKIERIVQKGRQTFYCPQCQVPQ